jgi:hypothetical protein
LAQAPPDGLYCSRACAGRAAGAAAKAKREGTAGTTHDLRRGEEVLVHFPGQTAAQLHAELAMLAPRALWTRAKECGVSLSEATDDYHSLVAIRAQTVEAELKARAAAVSHNSVQLCPDWWPAVVRDFRRHYPSSDSNIRLWVLPSAEYNGWPMTVPVPDRRRLRSHPRRIRGLGQLYPGLARCRYCLGEDGLKVCASPQCPWGGAYACCASCRAEVWPDPAWCDACRFQATAAALHSRQRTEADRLLAGALPRLVAIERPDFARSLARSLGQTRPEALRVGEALVAAGVRLFRARRILSVVEATTLKGLHAEPSWGVE